MPRSKDLDIIAPDDLSIISSTTIKSPKKSSKKKILKNISPVPEINEDICQDVYDILGHTKNPFSSLLIKPKILSFQERDQCEEIILALRAHWFTNVSWICITIFFIFVPAIFKYFPFLGFFPSNYQFITILFWYLITFIFAFEKFLSWYFDIYILTNKRIIDINFNNLLNKTFAEAELLKIREISSTLSGLEGTIFNYGTILIQTASEINQLIFEKIPNPEEVIKVLRQLQKKEQLEALEKGIK